jgi:flagellar biosynthesis/type III secretory pathway protein FliH
LSSQHGGVFRYLRGPRRAGEITLGHDGRPIAHDPDDDVSEDPTETAEAADIVARAHERAGEIVEQATRDATAIQHEAYREGRESGYRDGVTEARAELADALALVQRVGQEVRAVRDRVLWNAEREVIELVITVAQTVIGRQVELEPALVLDTVERALARAGAQNVVRIRVHPNDRDTVAVAMAEQHGDAVPFQVLSDHAVSVGGCVVDTEAGEVDARLDVQLAEVARVLRETVPEPSRGGSAEREAMHAA